MCIIFFYSKFYRRLHKTRKDEEKKTRNGDTNGEGNFHCDFASYSTQLMMIGPRRCAHIKQVIHFLPLLALLSVALFLGKSTRKHVCFPPPFSRVHALFCCLQKL